MKFTWRIENFSMLKFKTKKLYSNIFTVAGCKWRILIFPKGNNVDYLSIYLDVADSATLPSGWSRSAEFSLAVVNQILPEYTIKKATEHQFKATESDWGFTSFMPLTDLSNPRRGYIVNDRVIIEAEVVTGTVAATPAASEDGAGLKKSAKKPAASKELPPSTTPLIETALQAETGQQIGDEEEEYKQEATLEEDQDRKEEPEEEATDSTCSNRSSLPPQPKDSIGESTTIATETQLTPQKTLNHEVEVLDEDFEKEVFARLELLTDILTKEEPVTPGKGKAMMETETKDLIEIPTQEEINRATSIIQSLIKSNPSEICQEPDQKEILDAAQTLSRVPSLPASHRQFWTDFPSILQDFSQRFNDKQKIVAEAMAAQKKIEDGTTTLIHKREEYLKTKAEHALQSKEYQELLSELSQIEARLAELRNLIPEKKSTVDVLTSTRSNLLKELDVEGKQIMAEKQQAADVAEAAKLAAEDVQQMKKAWESWKDHLP